MFSRNAIVFSLFSLCWMLASAQEEHEHFGGACIIDGKARKGIDCLCYTNGLGVTFLIVYLVTIFICFGISGCIWKGIFSCVDCERKKNKEFESMVHSLRASMRHLNSSREQI